VSEGLAPLAVALILISALTGCGSQQITRTIRVSVKADPFAVRRGMTKKQLRTLAGDP
jgi:hypothetical protein